MMAQLRAAASIIWLAFSIRGIFCSVDHLVKIVDGVDKRSDNSDPSEYIQPSALPSGPSAIKFLNGLCFSKTAERFEYSVCPFQNVTQKRAGTAKPALLGVWGHWKLDEMNVNRHTVMRYTDGQPCAMKEKSATVKLACVNDTAGIGGDFVLLDIDDSTSICDYIFTLQLPLHCSLLDGPVSIRPGPGAASLENSNYLSTISDQSSVALVKSNETLSNSNTSTNTNNQIHTSTVSSVINQLQTSDLALNQPDPSVNSLQELSEAIQNIATQLKALESLRAKLLASRVSQPLTASSSDSELSTSP